MTHEQPDPQALATAKERSDAQATEVGESCRISTTSRWSQDTPYAGMVPSPRCSPRKPGESHMWAPSDLALLVCPACRGKLDQVPQRNESALHCTQCSAVWPVKEGIPVLYREEAVRGTDRLMRLFYDTLPVFHDPLTRHLLP